MWARRVGEEGGTRIVLRCSGSKGSIEFLKEEWRTCYDGGLVFNTKKKPWN